MTGPGPRRPPCYNRVVTRALQLLHAIEELGDALDDRVGPMVAAAELTSPQFNLLYLVEEEGPMRLGELARNRRCVKSNVSNLVRAMESAGLVQLHEDPDDRRARVVHATTLGRRRFRVALRRGDQIEQALRTSLGEAGVAQLVKLCLAGAATLDAAD